MSAYDVKGLREEREGGGGWETVGGDGERDWRGGGGKGGKDGGREREREREGGRETNREGGRGRQVLGDRVAEVDVKLGHLMT